ncbi:MAG: LuxR C-terminal-related transcriptional regulator, partial [Anaerolineae bacterium]
NTVATHRRHVMDKLGLRNKSQLIKYALRKGLISLDT